MTKTMIKTVSTLLLAACLGALPPLAGAHSDEHLDTIKTPHQGQLRMAGAYHLELVVNDNALLVYVTDHGDKPVESHGLTATAVVVSGKDRVAVKLQPAGDNLLKGRGGFILDPKMKVTVTVKHGNETAQATFQPMKKHGQ